MKNAFKVVGVSVFALALVFSGCGKGKKSSSRSSGSGDGSKEENSYSDPRQVAVNGRKLHQAIILANTNREQAGKGTTVWPRTESEEDGKAADNEEQDIGDRSFSSATEYFNALFDMKHYGMAERCPEVEDLDLGVLGKYACDGRTIRAAGLDWCIAANIRDGIFDDLPVLISANFNPAFLLREYDGKDNTPLPIGPESGAAKSMFNDEAIVVVRKGGAAEVIKKKYLTYDVLYKRTAFDLTDFSPPLKYFTPTGVVEPIGYGAWARAERFRGSMGRGDIRGEASVQPCSPSPAPELPEDDEDDEKKKEPPKSFP